MKTSINDQAASQDRKVRLFTKLLLLGMFIFYIHKVMFYHHVANVFRFMNQEGQPCHHHVRFNPILNDERPHSMMATPMESPELRQFIDQDESDSIQHGHLMNMGKPKIHPPPHHGDFHHKHGLKHHHMHLHGMGPPDIHILDLHHGAIRKPSPLPLVEEPEKVSAGKIHESMDSADDSEDSASSDSSDSMDESSDLDMWEHIKDFWTGDKDHSEDSSDSADDSRNENKNVWERIADMWELLTNENDRQYKVSSTDKSK
jgi:hypothetical protein